MKNGVNKFTQQNVKPTDPASQFLTVIDDRPDKDKAGVDVKRTWKLTTELAELKNTKAEKTDKLTGDLTFKQSAAESYFYSDKELDSTNVDYLMPEPGSTPAGTAGALSALTNTAEYKVVDAVKVPIAGGPIEVLGRTTHGVKQAVNTKVSDVELNVTGQQKNSTYEGTVAWKLANSYN